MNNFTLLFATGAAGFLCFTAIAGDFPRIFNTEDPSLAPPSPPEALRRFKVPDGFKVTLFAAEPDVRQPIAMAFDARGRLWVAENYTYAERSVNFDRRLRDRIVILEDKNQDGHFDERTIFWDKGQLLSSMEIGFGGVWALCPPHLVFIPDRDGDGTPDGEPEILLDGWNDNAVRHNLVNGLKWGPDGWLYGRHGILATSHVGKPGAPMEERQAINCGIWRYHPTRHVFEVLAHGTTNPWGMDWNEHGEPFFINTVIGHFWHLIPGAHYRRMYGEDLKSHRYGLIEQHADHFHWDTNEEWSDVRELGVTGHSSEAGGGHAHSGLMIYQGNNWPDPFRGRVFTVNFHGRRLNQDRLERHGSGYVARHEPDHFFSDDPWFRGVELISGPDGGVYVADWSDTGECHDDTGVHRTSGRVFKITYGQPAPLDFTDLAELSDRELARLQWHENDWFARQSRRLLQERAAAGHDLSGAKTVLAWMFENGRDSVRKLRAFWALHAIGATPDSWLRDLLRHENEHVRAWAVRFLTDSFPMGNLSASVRPEILEDLSKLASEEASALVRLVLGSTLQRLPLNQRAALAEPLLAHGADAEDHNIPLLLWYALEPLSRVEPLTAARLARETKIPLVRRYITRRLAEELETEPEPVNTLLRFAAMHAESAEDVLAGISEGLRGWRKAKKPAEWDGAAGQFASIQNPEIQAQVRDLSALFGDGRALEAIRQVALDPDADIPARQAAMQTLIEHRAPGLRKISEDLLQVRDLAGHAARGLALFEEPAIGEMLAEKYWHIAGEYRADAIAALVSRPSFARALLNRVGPREGQIPRGHLSAFHARQIRSFNHPELNRQLSEVWGELRDSDEERRQSIESLKAELTADVLRAADLSRGRVLYNQACAACHRLYGIGGELGPDLTGSGRDNIDYLLENIVDPSATVAADWRMAVVTLKDGRILNGVISARAERTLAVQTMTERIVLDRDEIEELEESTLSLMPEGLLEAYDAAQVRDLIAYLMAPRQVPLPEEQEGAR